jgi:predicted HAD superfamily Cof-like phosphohydrolase
MPTHAERIKYFKQVIAKQNCPDKPVLPTKAEREMLFRVLWEEVLELGKAIGVRININTTDENDEAVELNALVEDDFELVGLHESNCSLVEVADGVADVSVTAIGLAIACGINMDPILELVDANNIAKGGPGHTWRADGKLIKPPGHPKPDIESELNRQIEA